MACVRMARTTRKKVEGAWQERMRTLFGFVSADVGEDAGELVSLQVGEARAGVVDLDRQLEEELVDVGQDCCRYVCGRGPRRGERAEDQLLLFFWVCLLARKKKRGTDTLAHRGRWLTLQHQPAKG